MEMETGQINLILGCMFSGKSTELLRRCNRYEAINKNVLLINHISDLRTGDSVKTHSNVKHNALKTDSLLSIINNENFFLHLCKSFKIINYSCYSINFFRMSVSRIVILVSI